MLRSIAAGLAAATLAASASSAQSARSAEQDAPAPDLPTRISANYSGSVLMIKVAEIGLNAENRGEDYAATATFESAGLLRWFDDTDIEAGVTGYIQPGRLQPWRYSHLNHASGKGRIVGIDFPDGTAMPDIDPPFGSMGEPPATDAERAGALDPITTILSLMTGLPDPETGACTGRLPVFDGKARYDLRFENGGTERVRTRAWSGEAIRCEAYLEPISGYDEGKRPEGDEVNRPIEIWLAEIDGAQIPVRFRARTRIGGIGISATRIAVE